METEQLKARQHVFPCEQCGAQMQYLEGSTEMVCNHCDHRHQITLSRDPILEYDFHSTLKQLPGAAPDAVRMAVKCNACSAEFDFDPDLNADACPFCGTRIVVDAKEHRIIQPKSLLPFRITAKQAKESYRRWLKRLWFAPNALKKYARQQRDLNGIYVPYWTYDCDTATSYRGQRGDVYYVTQQVRVNVNGRMQTRTRQVPKIRWTPVAGRVQRHFDDVLVYATDSLPRSMARELSPWDLNALAPYQEEFLSGFQSEVYRVELDQGFGHARERMHPVIRADIRRDIGGDQQRITDADTRYSGITFKHILLPFWIAGFRFRGKVYQFIVNGRTGEVQGDRPYSMIKIALAVITALILAGAFATFYAQTQEGGSASFDMPSINWNTY